MRVTTTILFLVIYLAGFCQNKSNDSQKEPIIIDEGFIQNGFEIVVKKTSNDSNKIFDWNYIRNRTTLMKDSFNIENLDIYRLQTIPIEFLETYVKEQNIKFGWTSELGIKYPEEFRFYQHKEFPNFYFFSFIHANEYCCRTVYGVSLSKESLKPINIAVLGLTGGDGGWSENDTGYWESDSILKINKAQYNDESSDDNSSISEIDTLFAKIQIDNNGIFDFIKIDSVKYIGGQKIK